MAQANLLRSLNKMQKHSQFLAQKEAYKGDNVDNVQVRVRLFVANPGQPQELVVELEPDGPEEAAVLAIIDGAVAKKEARVDADLKKHGLKRTSRGIEIDPAGTPKA